MRQWAALARRQFSHCLHRTSRVASCVWPFASMTCAFSRISCGRLLTSTVKGLLQFPATFHSMCEWMTRSRVWRNCPPPSYARLRSRAICSGYNHFMVSVVHCISSGRASRGSQCTRGGFHPPVKGQAFGASPPLTGPPYSSPEGQAGEQAGGIPPRRPWRRK